MKSKKIIYVIGIGNSVQHITAEAKELLKTVDIIAGHFGFIEMVKEYISTNTKIVDDSAARNRAGRFIEYQQDRVSAVVNEVLNGNSVAVLSGGDSGIWGMAGVFLEAQKVFDCSFEVNVVPGIPTMSAIAARLGAPLLNGFSLIAVADEDMPFSKIEQRLKGAAIGGGVIVLFKLILENCKYPQYYPQDEYPELYPPEEKTKYRLQRTYDLLKEYIPGDRPIAIVTDVCDQTSNYSKTTDFLGSDNGKEEIIITTFDQFLNCSDSFRFFTSVVIGDENTVLFDKVMYTPQWHNRWVYKKEMIERVKELPYLKSQEAFFSDLLTDSENN